MTKLDDKLLPGVKKILNLVGAAAVLTEKAAAGDYDPTTGLVTDTPATHTVKITPPSPFEQGLHKGKMGCLLSGQLLTEGSVPTVEPGWLLTFKTEVFQVLIVEPLYSGESIAALELVLGS